MTGGAMGRILLLAVVGLLCAFGCGCGSSGSGTSSANTSSTSSGGAGSSGREADGSSAASKGPSLSKAQFIKQADAFCRKADSVQEVGLQKAGKEGALKNPSKAEQEKLVTEIGLPPLRVELEEISSLSPPKADEAKIGEIIQALEGAIEESEEAPIRVTLGQGNPFERVNQMAGDFGFKDCSEAL